MPKDCPPLHGSICTHQPNVLGPDFAVSLLEDEMRRTGMQLLLLGLTSSIALAKGPDKLRPRLSASPKQPTVIQSRGKRRMFRWERIGLGAAAPFACSSVTLKIVREIQGRQPLIRKRTSSEPNGAVHSIRVSNHDPHSVPVTRRRCCRHKMPA
jgi:hypothetical protein